MSLDKAIKYGKEKRTPYRGAQACDATCRPHGTCPWCQGNRKHRDNKRELSAIEQLEPRTLASATPFDISTLYTIALRYQAELHRPLQRLDLPLLPRLDLPTFGVMYRPILAFIVHAAQPMGPFAPRHVTAPVFSGKLVPMGEM